MHIRQDGEGGEGRGNKNQIKEILWISKPSMHGEENIIVIKIIMVY